MTQELLLSARQAGMQLGVSATSAVAWFKEGRFPKAYSVTGPSGRCIIRIPLSDVEALKRQPFRSDIESLPAPGIRPEAQAREVV